MNQRRFRIVAFFMLVLFATQSFASLIQTFDLSIEGRVSTVDHQHCADKQSPISLDVLFDTDRESNTCNEGCQHCVGSCSVVFCGSELDAIPVSLATVLAGYAFFLAEGSAEILFHPPRLA
jgi:hypothetical protein